MEKLRHTKWILTAHQCAAAPSLKTTAIVYNFTAFESIALTTDSINLTVLIYFYMYLNINNLTLLK